MTSGTQAGAGYPRLLRGLALAEADSGLVVEGGPRRRLLSGQAGGISWGSLLPLLDGTRSVADCASELGVAPGVVSAAVRTLDDCDLIETGAGQFADAESSVSTFLSRTVRLTGQHDNGQLAARALRDSVVIVAAPEAFAAAICADVRATGVGATVARAGAGRVTAQDIERAAAAWPRCAVVAWDGPGEEGSMRSLERTCAQARVPLLRFACRADQVEVGPLFFADSSACYSCFADRHSAGFPATLGLPATAGLPGEPVADERAWLAAALVVREVLAVTGQLTGLDSYRRLTVTSLKDLVQRRFLVTRRPGCPDCANGLPQFGPSALAADAYEWQAESPPPELLPPRPRSARSRGAIPPPRHGGLWTSPRYALPEADPEAAATAPGSRLDPSVLAAILKRAGAPLGQWRQLADPGLDASSLPGGEPDAGNFGSTELLVITGPQRAACASGDLPADGVFWYDSRNRELILTQRSGAGMTDPLSKIGLSPDEPPLCVIVFVAAVWRLVQGHGLLAYRVAHLDAGGATSRLAQAAAEYGLRASFACDWQPQLPGLLELRPEMEMLVAIAGLYPGEDPCL